MALFLNPLALEAQLNWISSNCNKIVVLGYAHIASDSYATVNTSSNHLAVITSPTNFDSTDFTVTSSGNTRTLNFAAGNYDLIADNSGTATNVAFLDTANSRILFVIPVISQVITAGNQVNFPAMTYTVYQPT